jgi:hypothetical protein
MLKQLQFFVLFCCMLGASTSFAMIPRLCTRLSGMVGNGLKSIKSRIVLERHFDIDDTDVKIFILGALYIGCECVIVKAAMQEKKAAMQEKSDMRRAIDTSCECLKRMAAMQEKKVCQKCSDSSSS